LVGNTAAAKRIEVMGVEEIGWPYLDSEVTTDPIIHAAAARERRRRI
jgi:hypothetical protein